MIFGSWCRRMKNLYMNVFASLIIFAAILIAVFSWLNYMMLREMQGNQQQELWNLVENNVMTDMQTVDKAYLYFDESYTEKMEKELKSLRNYYKKNPEVETWDIAAIKERTEMEFYIIDTTNTIIKTTYQPAQGLDFNECCEKFAKLLNERRAQETFVSDGLDNSAATKDLWKYGYIATADHQYILELGVPLSDTQLFKSFNFFDSSASLKEKYNDLKDIRIISSEGFFLESSDDKESIHDMPKTWQSTYNKAVESGKAQRYESELKNGKKMIYRFKPYTAENRRGNSTDRVIYTAYTNDTEMAMLKESRRQLEVMLAVAFVTSIMALLIIFKIFTRPLRLATYDVLTNVYNRAFYLQQMHKMMQHKQKYPIGLLLMDLDNFKQVNDQFGHPVGDEVLKQFAQILHQNIEKGHYVVRFGGDEFGIILEKATEQKMIQLSQKNMNSVHDKTGECWNLLTTSIGGAIQQCEDETENSLFARADDALYKTKKKGKDGYTYAA